MSTSLSTTTTTSSSLELCVATVSYHTKFGRKKKGLCSAWLTTLKIGDKIPFLIHQQGSLSRAFSQAISTSKPIICIGPGTGIAPMRSIWREATFYKEEEEEEEEKKAICVYLFFGCRHREKDWLYKEESLSLSS